MKKNDLEFYDISAEIGGTPMQKSMHSIISINLVLCSSALYYKKTGGFQVRLGDNPSVMYITQS
jgi:hypothetical protein